MFKKADEMEMSINMKAMKYAFLFSSLFLIVWINVELFKFGKFDPIALDLLFAQNFIFFGTKVILTRRMEKNEK